jgi:predicted house-cleaning noncanonical NTP pyrophosphatase (MazG superfamily)
VPAIIAADGHQAVSRVLDPTGYEAALRAKLLEEAHEAQAAPDGKLASEPADVLEVLQALAAAHFMGWEDVVSEARRRRAERGGFDKRIFLEYVDRDGDPRKTPCLAHRAAAPTSRRSHSGRPVHQDQVR